MQSFFLNGLLRFLKNGHLPVKLHSSAPPGDNAQLALEANIEKLNTIYVS